MLRPQIDLDATDQQRVEEYAEEHGLRMSRAYADLLNYALDEQVGPTDEELRNAYQENAEQAREINREWAHVSTEANQYLDDPAELDDEAAGTPDDEDANECKDEGE
jgi:antitoxin component of RelBE/YafQ-DinJ toxin-antitoxin module